MVWPHGILHSTVRVVDVLHGDVAVAIARLRGGDGRRGARLCGVRIDCRLVLIVFEARGRLLDLSGLLRVFTSGRHLTGTVVSSRSASSVLIALPLIHGERAGEKIKTLQLTRSLLRLRLQAGS
jgi:hypothetical protein